MISLFYQFAYWKIYFLFLSSEPPRVLKPKDLAEAESRAWRPQIGMNPRSRGRAFLGDAGHRMLK